jgi:hypothetical protein
VPTSGTLLLSAMRSSHHEMPDTKAPATAEIRASVQLAGLRIA